MPVSQNCVREYPLERASVPSWEIRTVERVWGEPLSEDLILVGGVDGYGWARACRVSSVAANIFEGEYRDQTMLYRGRFRLETEEGKAAPEDALALFYVSHFSYPHGLILYPVTEGPPPVKTLRLVPIDTDGFKFPSTAD
ncbi:hypothetical protein MIM_c35290 [Advenella mimigardefordensis DPN7]|uniref:Uncharacterized protein n=2 Tax=Advenella mimigardefordensis TaxID=302406 RepID=W0PF17_ADVMD|nr:hypothetical protein MIM_c35290 [Advenella mimigardefordensis DPN7]